MNDDRLNSYSERDLLIMVLERIDGHTRRLDKLEADVEQLKLGSASQRGFLSGVDWLRGIVVAAPPAVLAFLFGRNS